MGHVRPPAKDHLRRNALLRRARSLGLLLGLSLQPLVAISARSWSDDIRLSDIEPLFTCQACGQKGADVRPNFNWNARGPIGGMGYRIIANA